jgi:hypothetical protein
MTGLRRSREQYCVVGNAVAVGRGEKDGPVASIDGYGVVVGSAVPVGVSVNRKEKIKKKHVLES